MFKKDSPYTLRDLLITKLQALYDVESEIIKALPKMAEMSSDETLAEIFESHLEETKAQAGRLEQAFEILGTKPKKLKVEAIRGMVKDSEWLIDNIERKEVLDAALITSARYVEHYEMAGYMSAKELSELLEEDEVTDLLDETLTEEQAADMKLAAAAIVVNALVPIDKNEAASDTDNDMEEDEE